jgi:hypothetical protein
MGSSMPNVPENRVYARQFGDTMTLTPAQYAAAQIILHFKSVLALAKIQLAEAIGGD